MEKKIQKKAGAKQLGSWVICRRCRRGYSCLDLLLLLRMLLLLLLLRWGVRRRGSIFG
jgi:hypothetical protein